MLEMVLLGGMKAKFDSEGQGIRHASFYRFKSFTLRAAVRSSNVG
jgi:hypothetical protein